MNKKFTVLVGLLMAVAVTGYSVSGTYAKYTEEFTSAASTATIAKWDVTVGDATTETGKDFSFDLMQTSTNTSLVAGEATKLLAPGSTGQFKIKIKNSSDVKAEYTVTFDTTGVTVPLKYKVNGGAASTTIANVTTPVQINESGEAEIVVDWEWPWIEADETSLASTKDTTKTVEVTATVTVSQVATTNPSIGA